ncbi:hypothetical protein [Streptomyces sp. NPDC048489]
MPPHLDRQAQQAAAQGGGVAGRDKLTQEQLEALRELGVEWA